MSTRTRYAILGVGGLALAVAVGLLIALGLRSLSASGPSALPTPTTTPTAAVEAPVAAQPAPEAPAPRPEAGRNECVDELGDSVIDLDSVRLELDDGDLVAQFRLAGELPAGDSGVGLTVLRDRDRLYQLGVSFVDGEVDSVFVRDFDRSDIQTVDDDAVALDGSTITVVFPRSDLKGIGNQWSWFAFATAEGATLDACPGTEADPQYLQFER